MSQYPTPNISQDLTGQTALVTGAVIKIDDGQHGR